MSWSEDRKTDPDMLANASGVPGLEVMVALFVKGALERGIPLTWAARLMAENPARHFRLDDVKGALTPGRDADIIVMTPEPLRLRRRGERPQRRGLEPLQRHEPALAGERAPTIADAWSSTGPGCWHSPATGGSCGRPSRIPWREAEP